MVNFSTLKSGGGQNVALNFLYSVKNCNAPDISYHFLVAKNSEAYSYLTQNNLRSFTVVPRNALLRILFEIFVGWYILKKNKIHIVYSYFGYAWFPKKWPQITGSADSNLYFPEIDFWIEFKGLKKWGKFLVDLYRVFGVKRANAVIFENEVLEQRSHSLFKLKETTTIKPSINIGENHLHYQLPVNCQKNAKLGLFLCGWQLNKNVMLIPQIAAEMNKRCKSFEFILTAPPNMSNEHKLFCNLVKKFNVDNIVHVVGPVKKNELASLYKQIDYVFLLSKLESFSNNIIEAWYFCKPLIVADELWARSICKDAAVYVKRDFIIDISDKICQLLDSDDESTRIIENGKNKLREYPTINSRTDQELEYIRYVYKNL